MLKLPLKMCAVFLMLVAFASLGVCVPGQSAPLPRIVALGDLHGDLDASLRALQLAGAIDAQRHWRGGKMILVQMGDRLDRGDHDREVLDLFENLSREAPMAGGQVYALNGNHEIMNARGDMRYVTEGGFRSFASLNAQVLQREDLSSAQQAALQRLPALVRPRLEALLSGGLYARKLARHKTILQLGDTIFVHGGLLPQYVDYGIERINREYSAWLRGTLFPLPALLNTEQAPIWTRAYSDPNRPADCAQLTKALHKTGARRMVVAHSVQPEINATCAGQVWRIDTGMSHFYGGPIQALEIQGDQVRVLRE